MTVIFCLEGRSGTFFSFFCSKIKWICELWHTFFINLRLQQVWNLQPSALFYKNLRSRTGRFTYSAICGNTYAPPPPHAPIYCWSFITLPCSMIYCVWDKGTSETVILVFCRKSKVFYTSVVLNSLQT